MVLAVPSRVRDAVIGAIGRRGWMVESPSSTCLNASFSKGGRPCQPAAGAIESLNTTSTDDFRKWLHGTQEGAAPAPELPTGLALSHEQERNRHPSGSACVCPSSRAAFLQDTLGLVMGEGRLGRNRARLARVRVRAEALKSPRPSE